MGLTFQVVDIRGLGEGAWRGGGTPGLGTG